MGMRYGARPGGRDGEDVEALGLDREYRYKLPALLR